MIVGVMGAKGGVGKTSVTINLASALTEFGRSCIIVDADLQKPNLGLHLGITKMDKSVQQSISGEHKLHEASLQHPSGLYVIPCQISAEYEKHGKHHDKLGEQLSHLQAEIVLLDCPSSLEKSEILLSYCDAIIVVATPDLSAVTDALRTLRLSSQKGTKVMGVVLNKINEHDFQMDADNVEAVLGHKVIGIVPYDTKLREAESYRYPVVFTHHNANVTIGFKKLAANLIGEPFEPEIKTSFWNDLLMRTGLK